MVRRLAALALVVTTFLLGTATAASAHASMISTDPQAGAELAAAPSSVSVTFDEPVRTPAGSVRVLAADGSRVDRGRIERLDGGRTIQLQLDDLDDGAYVTTWRVVSADNHPVSGGAPWQVGEASAADQAAAGELLAGSEGDEVVEVGGHVARGVLFASVLLLAGGWAFLLLLWPAGTGDRRARRILDLAAGAGVVATVAGLGLQAANEAGLGLGAALRPSLLRDELGTEFGFAALLRLVALAAALATTRLLARTRNAALLACVAVTTMALLLSVTLAGHARGGRWLLVAALTDLIHLLAAATWVGGLALLLVVVLPRSTVEESRAVAARFSPVAFAAVLVLVATGSLQGFRQLGSIGAIDDSQYGRLLLLKIGAFVVLVGLAAYTRAVVRTTWATDDDPAGDEGRRALRQGIGAEALLAAVVLAITAVLATANPSEAQLAVPFVDSEAAGSVVVDVTVTPARAGRNTIHLYVTANDAGLTDEVEVTLRASMTDGGIEPLDIDVVPTGARHWTAEAAQLPLAGTWDLAVTVRVGEFDSTTLRFDVPIS